MKFLCLAYGTETDWVTLPEHEQKVLLTQDEAIRSRGALMAAVAPTVSTVRAWNGAPEVDAEGVVNLRAPLAGFSIIEADSIDEVIALVAATPCARAKGAIEIRPITTINDTEWRQRR